MQNFYMMVGLPGSGKSKYVADHFKTEDVYSSDAIRKEMFGDETIQDRNTDVFAVLDGRVMRSISLGRDVVVDATNLRRKNRVHLLNCLSNRKDLHKVAIIMNVSVDDCIKNDAKRDRHVGEFVIRRMEKTFDCPAMWEGFDEIRVNTTPDPNFVKFCSHFNYAAYEQHNSHHDFTLGVHMNETCKYVQRHTKGDKDIALEIAALFHDIGKIETQTFKDSNGNPSEEAHYYGHDHVGAYMMLNYMFMSKRFDGMLTFDQKIDICTLIGLHENIRGMDRDGKKYRNLVRKAGHDFVNRLELLSKADERCQKKETLEADAKKEMKTQVLDFSKYHQIDPKNIVGFDSNTFGDKIKAFINRARNKK